MLSRRNVFLAGVLVMALLPSFANPYALFIGTMLSTYVILALGLNLLVGYAGQLAFANAAMYGIGAYTCGLLQVKLGVSYWLALPAGALVAMAIGSVMAFPALRLSGLYLALATLAFAQFTQWVFLNWESVTFGAGGFKVPEVSFAWAGIASSTGVFYLALILAALLYVVAGNVVRSAILRNAAKSVLNLLRSISELIWAIFFVAAVGLGPFPGALALGMNFAGILGRLYAEAMENVDPGPIEAMQATGAGRLQVILFAILPQALPQFVTYNLYWFEVGVRSATVLGMVGAGGIGFELVTAIRLFEWREVGIILLIILGMVTIIDWASTYIRSRIY